MRAARFVVGLTAAAAVAVVVVSPSSATAAAAGAPPAGATPAGLVLPSPAARFVAGSASFVDARFGWALGSAPCGRLACTAVLRTSDGGGSWQRTGAPPARLGVVGPASVTSIRFVDHRHGYALTSGLWTTNDAGAHWARLLKVAGIAQPFVYAVAGNADVVFALVSGTDRKYGSGSDGHYRLVRAVPGSDTFPSPPTWGAGTRPH